MVGWIFHTLLRTLIKAFCQRDCSEIIYCMYFDQRYFFVEISKSIYLFGAGISRKKTKTLRERTEKWWWKTTSFKTMSSVCKDNATRCRQRSTNSRFLLKIWKSDWVTPRLSINNWKKKRKNCSQKWMLVSMPFVFLNEHCATKI